MKQVKVSTQKPSMSVRQTAIKTSVPKVTPKIGKPGTVKKGY